MVNRKHAKSMDQRQTERFLEAARKLHAAINFPLLDLNSPQKAALRQMNEHLLADIVAVTGRKAEWTIWGSTGPSSADEKT